MYKYLRLCACAAAALAVLPSTAANLISNPGNEEALVAGEIAGWTEVVGTGWTQRSADPLAAEGTYYFFAGAGPSATLRQLVDVRAFASDIDAGQVALAFSGYVRSFLQSPPDVASIELTFLSATDTALGSFLSGQIANTAAWQLVSTEVTAPSLTRSVLIDLISVRRAGSNNDGYFDNLSLEVVAVPEPRTAFQFLVGLGAIGFFVRSRRPRLKGNR